MFDWNRIKQRAKMFRPLLVPLILYIGSLAFVIIWLGNNVEASIRWLLVLLPLVFVKSIAHEFIKLTSRLDELERKMLTDGMAGSFVATLLLLFGLELLEAAQVIEIRSIYILLFMLVTWLIGKLWAMRKYQ